MNIEYIEYIEYIYRIDILINSILFYCFWKKKEEILLNKKENKK